MKSSQKTFIILSPGFAANEADSTCLPAQQQLVNAIKEGFPSVRIIILAFQYPFAGKTYQWNNVTVVPFNGKNKGKLSRLFVWMLAWKQLAGLKKKYSLVGLFSFWYGECALIGTLFGKRNGIPHFTWLLGQDAREGNKYARFLHPKGNALVALSDFLAKEFEKNYGIQPAHIIPAGIDTRHFDKRTVERDIDILGVGSLIPLKRYDWFVEVVKVLHTTTPGIRAMICGKGEEEKKLAGMIELSGMQESITLAGEIAYPEVLRLMQRSKIFLHTSSYEGFGLVCLEALYAGAQVISFCKPVTIDIPHWHIVSDLDAMIRLSHTLLQSGKIDHSPVLPYTMAETASAVMQLFDHNETAIS
jgi:glycosyltransferase involved in cell wall biosynthesis